MRAIVLILIGAAGALVIVCCGGGGLLMHLGTAEFARQVQDDLSDNPVIREQIGEIENFKFQYGASFMEEEDDVYVFRIRGAKGSGTVTADCKTIDEDTEEVTSGTLTLSTGETLDLFPGAPAE